MAAARGFTGDAPFSTRCAGPANWMAAPLSVTVKPCASSVPNGPSAWVGSALGGGAVLQIDRGAGGRHRRAVVAIQRDVAGQVELVGVLQEDAAAWPAASARCRSPASCRPSASVRLIRSGPTCCGSRRRHGVGAAMLVHAAVARIGQRRAADLAADALDRRCGPDRCTRSDLRPERDAWPAAASARAGSSHLCSVMTSGGGQCRPDVGGLPDARRPRPPTSCRPGRCAAGRHGQRAIAHATPARSRSWMCRMPTGPVAGVDHEQRGDRALPRVHGVQRLGRQRVRARSCGARGS